MKCEIIILLLHCAMVHIVLTEKSRTVREIDDEDYEDVERGHRKRKRFQYNQNHQNNPCDLGSGRFFGLEQTYVTNYFINCRPNQYGGSYQNNGYGHHGHGHHGHGHHGHGHRRGQGYGGNQGFNNYGNYNPHQQNQPFYDQNQYSPNNQNYQHDTGFTNYQQNNQNRPIQSLISSAASGLGTALTNYLSNSNRVNKQLNRLSRPLNYLF